jgi:hypothetical protein
LNPAADLCRSFPQREHLSSGPCTDRRKDSALRFRRARLIGSLELSSSAELAVPRRLEEPAWRTLLSVRSSASLPRCATALMFRKVRHRVIER